jgi:2-isopropylmalate synthase
MWEAFQQNYLASEPHFRLNSHELRSDSTTGRTSITAQLVIHGSPVTIVGEGNGPIDAFVHALGDGIGAQLNVLDYAEHAIGQGSEAHAVAYVETSEPDGVVLWGVGVDPNIITASLRAVLNAHERHQL